MSLRKKVHRLMIQPLAHQDGSLFIFTRQSAAGAQP
jgi:hypothetical protein